MNKVKIRLPLTIEPLWRSVRIEVPYLRDQHGRLLQGKDGGGIFENQEFFLKYHSYLPKGIKLFLLSIAKRYKIPKSQVSVRHTRGNYGYIRIYRGVGTKEDRALLKTVQRTIIRELGKTKQ
jgi:hypothetical protein